MVDTSQGKLLYIEPIGPKSPHPVRDELSNKMRLLLTYAKDGERWRGFHYCQCGERSDNTDWILPDGTQTNSLCVHYLEYHRGEVPLGEIAKLQAMEVPK